MENHALYLQILANVISVSLCTKFFGFDGFIGSLIGCFIGGVIINGFT